MVSLCLSDCTTVIFLEFVLWKKDIFSSNSTSNFPNAYKLLSDRILRTVCLAEFKSCFLQR